MNHLFASILWHKPDKDLDRCGNPTTTWELNDFLLHGPSSFIHLLRIYGRFASAQILTDGEKKTVTVPMENNCLHDETVILVLSVVCCTQAWFYQLLTEVFLFFFF